MMRWVKGEEGERVRIGDGIKRGEKNTYEEERMVTYRQGEYRAI